jgi:hypothetical protein
MKITIKLETKRDPFHDFWTICSPQPKYATK